METHGLKPGGYTKEVDRERLGPTLDIAASMIVAIRTARMLKPEGDPLLSNRELDEEIDRALKLAQRVLSSATHRWPEMFRQKEVPAWYEPDGTDVML